VHSSAGRASPLHGGGREFESLCTHQNAAVVQLVRISACHAEGRGFKSRPLRQIKRQHESVAFFAFWSLVMKFFLSFFLFIWSSFLMAEDLPFKVVFGDWVQGSLLTIELDTPIQVWADNRALMVSAKGHSVFGVGRDATEVMIRWQDTKGVMHHHKQAVTTRSYNIQQINGLSNNKVNPNPQEVAEIKQNNADIALQRSKRERFIEPQFPFLWPVSGRISGVYGSQRVLNGQPRRPHFGVDIAAPEGTPVYAPDNAKVLLAHPAMVLTGKTLLLDHGLGVKSVYVHLSEIAVHVGDTVKRGQLIGRVGKTGRATGSHLHWGVSWFDLQLDAMKAVDTPLPPLLN
jgi:murein DD-endopeptidase MepM/ murein hydrolase activator NlpD